MTTVVNVPRSLDDLSFEKVFDQVAHVPADEKIIINARSTTWASPYALTALLCVAQTRLERPQLAVPERDDTTSYWSKASFFEYADDLYEIVGKVPRSRAGAESSVLLGVTPVSKTEDVHGVVEKIQSKAQTILQGTLHLEASVAMRFTMALSEICQNVIEHAGRGGWACVHVYRFTQRLGRQAVQIAVCDAGIGFRQSLETSLGATPDRWTDAIALEDTVMRGVTRFHDPGRGQGLAGVRKFLYKWQGKISVRSGTARIAIVPEWDEDEPMREGLAPFPGAQVQITIPERMELP